MKLYEIRAVFFNRGSVEPLGSASGFQRFRRNRPKLSGTKFATTVRCGCNNIDQCFSTPSPRTHLSPRKALESVSTRGKQVCCNILTQQWLYQLHTIDIFVRTAIKIHLNSVKKSKICCSTWHLYIWGSVVSNLSSKLLSKLQFVFVVLVYNC